MSEEFLEIERRWLIPSGIFFPDDIQVQKLEITQLYLLNKKSMERVRQVKKEDDSIEFIHTIKRPAEKEQGYWETEEVVTPDKFKTLMERQDKSRQVVIKHRYVFEINDLKYELDQFIYPVDFRVLEVELKEISQPVPIPEWLGKSIEITNTKGLSNYSISKNYQAAIQKVEKIIATYHE